MKRKPTIAVSRCLLGDKVRYDGTDKHAHLLLETLAHHMRFIPICPEAEIGLGVPRPPMRLEGTRANVRLIVIESGREHTQNMRAYARSKVAELIEEGVDGYLLKARSPSCGQSVPVVGPGQQTSFRTRGLFTAQVHEQKPEHPIADEEQLSDADGLNQFVEAVRERHRARVGREPTKG